MMSFDVTSSPSLLSVIQDRVGVACNDHAHSCYSIDMYCIQDRGLSHTIAQPIQFNMRHIPALPTQFHSLVSRRQATSPPSLIWLRFHECTCLRRPVSTTPCEYGPLTTTLSGKCSNYIVASTIPADLVDIVAGVPTECCAWTRLPRGWCSLPPPPTSLWPCTDTSTALSQPLVSCP